MEHIEAAAGNEPGVPEPTGGNLLVTGDAMHLLDALAKIPEYADEYLGKVKLVYIDPPFNTGQAFTNYEDNIEHSIWLTMLRDRLRQIRPLLSPDGSVWVHLDHVESHRCRAVLDEEFGAEHFVAEVAWQKTYAVKSDSNTIPAAHDVILVYRKTSSWRPNLLSRSAKQESLYRAADGDPVPWQSISLSAPGALPSDHAVIFGIQHPITGRMVYPPPGRHWGNSAEWFLGQMSAWAKFELREIDDRSERAAVCGLPLDRMRSGVKAVMLAEPFEDAAHAAQERYNAGSWPPLHFTKGGVGGFRMKKYLDPGAGGLAAQTWWPFDEVGHNQSAKSEIQALFPGEHAFATPKPERLLQRVIHLATAPGDIVLDCFAGSGTTAAVAHKMGRRWVTGELHAETVEKYCKPRLARVVRGDDPGGITSTTVKVAGPDGLPLGVDARQADAFQATLKRVLRAGTEASDSEIDLEMAEYSPSGQSEEVSPLTIDLAVELAKIGRGLQRKGSSPLTQDETDLLLVLLKKMTESARFDITPQTKAVLAGRTKTMSQTTKYWHGGGGFTHLAVGPSMFVEVGGMLLLAQWAAQSELSKVICAQLSVRYQPDGIFAGKKGRTRYVVIDGMVGTSTIEAILDRSEASETVELWATQIEPAARALLRELRPGSTLNAIPATILDNYRRRTAQRTPFGGYGSSAIASNSATPVFGRTDA